MMIFSCFGVAFYWTKSKRHLDVDEVSVVAEDGWVQSKVIGLLQPLTSPPIGAMGVKLSALLGNYYTDQPTDKTNWRTDCAVGKIHFQK